MALPQSPQNDYGLGPLVASYQPDIAQARQAFWIFLALLIGFLLLGLVDGPPPEGVPWWKTGLGIVLMSFVPLFAAGALVGLWAWRTSIRKHLLVYQDGLVSIRPGKEDQVFPWDEIDAFWCEAVQ